MPIVQSYFSHTKNVARIGLPLVGGHLAQFAIGLTDTVMMGWHSIDGLAALVLGSTFFFVFFLMGSGFAGAVMPLVAAAGDTQTIRRVTRMGLWLSGLTAICVMPLFWWSAPLLKLLGQDPHLAEQAQTYLRIVAPALLPALGVMVLKNYLAAQERTSIVFWVTLLAAAANALVNYVLIFGNWGAPELGVAGAAWASVTVQLISFAVISAYALGTLPEHALFQRLWKPDFDVMARVIRLGIPIGLTMLSEVGLFAASAILMGWFGAIALAAHGIALQLATATFMVHLGLSNAATIFAGQAYGRGDRPNLRRGAIVIILTSGLFAIITIMCFLGIPETLISLFLNRDEPNRVEILSIGTGLLVMAALFQLADGAQVLALGLLRGLQDTTVPMIMAAISYWPVGLSAAYLLGFHFEFGPNGVWAGLVLGLTCAATMMMIRFWKRA